MSIFRKFSHHRILVVDDEEFCISSMMMIMEHCGIDIKNRVDFCITGMESFNLVMEAYDQGMSYDLILTDFNMPIMNGVESTIKIRKYLNEK